MDPYHLTMPEIFHIQNYLAISRIIHVFCCGLFIDAKCSPFQFSDCDRAIKSYVRNATLFITAIQPKVSMMQHV